MVELSAEFLKELATILEPKAMVQDQSQMQPFLSEWRGRWHGNTPLLALPSTTEQMAALVSLCAKYHVAITPQGGNTGLVGGQIPQGELLISTKNLNKIRQINPPAMTITVEAGVTLHEVSEIAAKHQLYFPLELASGGSATIGGAISTNAGGMGVLRYGNMRALVLGIEAILPNGDQWNGLSELHKDNTGYDLKQLFIGAEGTLGIVTAVSLRLFAQPATTITAWCGLQSTNQALKLLSLCREALGDQLSKFELVSEQALSWVISDNSTARAPFNQSHPWSVLIEFGLNNHQHGTEQVTQTLHKALQSGLIKDAVIAKSDAEAKAFLVLRENISAAQKSQGAAIKHDISLPLSKIPDFLQTAEREILRLVPNTRFCVFGHLGDGNLHYNLLQPVEMTAEKFLAKRQQITSIVHDLVNLKAGSFSAEHGIGIAKIADLHRYKTPIELSMMQTIKSTFDPQSLMNPRLWFGN